MAAKIQILAARSQAYANNFKTGDFLVLENRIIRADRVHTEKNEKGQNSIVMIEFYYTVENQSIEVEFIHRPKILKVIPFNNQTKNYLTRNLTANETESPTFTDFFGVYWSDTPIQENSKKISELESCEPLPQTKAKRPIDTKALEQSRKEAFLRKLTNKRKQAILIMDDLRILWRKDLACMNEAVRRAEDLGLEITKAMFVAIRNEKQEQRKAQQQARLYR